MKQTVKQTILENIQFEAMQHIKYGKTLPKRQPMWDAEVAQALVRAKEQLEVQFEETYEAIYKTSDSKLPFAEWLTIAKSLYIIQGTTVISKAKGKQSEVAFVCKSFGEAQNRVKKLLGYKQYDHFVKGCDFKYIPEQFQKVG